MDDEARQRFADFVASRTPALMRTAQLLTGDRHAAEDLLQVALARTLIRWRFLRDDNPEGYVRRVMYREQVSWWRRLARYREISAAQRAEPATPDPAADADLRLAMRAALLRLPPAQRTVLVLRYYEDLTETQVAEELGCSVGTVRSRTHRAVARLRQLIPTPEHLEVLR
ncbi:SigE family RNA polymerase sigma factor [Plantactinospora siamensis]|uniref:SigE family RNA polymerase sigma factor n=1 Tax=Plantactinospora siamensis TaxID=555372 RepID=A0ABV6NWZ5_9ACTN